MTKNGTAYSSEFRQQAHKYIMEHPDLTQAEIAENLGIPIPTLARWKAKIRQYGYIPVNSRRVYKPQNANRSNNLRVTQEKDDSALVAELKKLQEEIVILKRTIHILSQDISKS